MRILKIAVMALAATIVGASLAVASAGAATTLQLDQGAAHVPLAPGASFTASQQEFNGSKFVVFTTEAGTVECRNESNHNALLGELASNGLSTDVVSFTAGGFEFGEPCKFAGESAFVEPLGLPWTMSIHRSGKLVVKGTPKVEFVIDFPSGAVCTFQARAFRGTAPAAQQGAETPLTLAFADQRFKLEKHASSGACPASAGLSMELETTGEEGQVFETLVKS
jgi:hypothetical protein